MQHQKSNTILLPTFAGYNYQTTHSPPCFALLRCVLAAGPAVFTASAPISSLSHPFCVYLHYARACGARCPCAYVRHARSARKISGPIVRKTFIVFCSGVRWLSTMSMITIYYYIYAACCVRCVFLYACVYIMLRAWCISESLKLAGRDQRTQKHQQHAQDAAHLLIYLCVLL